MKPEGSLPLSQELSTSPYHSPDKSSPHHPILSLQDIVKGKQRIISRQSFSFQYHVACIGQNGRNYKMLVLTPEGKRPLATGEDNIKTALKK
jgi:hypothetical protein